MRDYFEKLKKFTFYEWILFLFPLSLVLGAAYVNIFLIFSSYLFIYHIIKKKKYSKINLIWIYFYLIFISYNLFRGFFASDPIGAVISSFSQFRFLFFALFFYLCIQNKENLKSMMPGWLALVVLVCLDSIYQYFFFKDIFGYPISVGYPEKSIRLSGPFGDRLVVGTFITFTSIPIISYYLNRLKEFSFLKKIIFILIYFLLLLTVTLSGERLAFIMFTVASILIFIFYLNLKKIIIFSLLIFSFLIGIYFQNESFRARVADFNQIVKNFQDSSYGRLYESSYLLFKNNYTFGVGLKNYRIDCDNQVDPRPSSLFQFCSTHPHNFYLEILAETGLMGFAIFIICFFYFIKFVLNEIKNNVNFKKYSSIALGNALILFIYFFPLKTSGSFFTTWNGSFFWFNLGLLLLMIKDEKNYK
jgi:O-antigen ligase